MAKIEFTIVYDWLARRGDLGWPEKIVIAHILRYGMSKYGCFKSNSSIAKALGVSRVTVIRIISRLEARGWLVKRNYPNRERSLFVNQEKLDDMPLLAGVKGCGKPVSLAVKSSDSSACASGAALPGSGAAPLAGSGAAPPPLNRNRIQCFLLNNEETKEETGFSSSKRRDRVKLTEDQFEQQKQRLLAQIQKEKS